MNLAFTKMQGLGNDFVVLNAADLIESGAGQIVELWETHAPNWARHLCNRQFGIGADALIMMFDLTKKGVKLPPFVERYPGSGDDQFAWSYINSDGSGSKTCGNGLRCAALFLKDRNLVSGAKFSISTANGSMPIHFIDRDTIETDLGAPVLAGRAIPTGWSSEQCVAVPIDITCFDTPYELLVTSVGFGNPHCVIFGDVRGDGKVVIDRADTESLGKVARFIQTSSHFPEGVNVEFATVKSRDQVDVKVYERGCGWTLACGSGAAATIVAGVLENRIERQCEIALPGGSAYLSWNEVDNRVRLRGPAREVFSGTFNQEKIAEGALMANLREVVA